MTKIFRLWVVLSILTAVPPFSDAAEKRLSYVLGAIEFTNGQSGNWNFVNRQLSFETRVGKIQLWLHELRNIAPSKSGRASS